MLFCFIIFLNHVQKEIFYCNYNSSVFKKETTRSDHLSTNSEHFVRLVICSLILVTCLTACYHGYSKNKKAPRHLYPTCNKCASTSPLRAGACTVLLCVYIFIFTRVLTFFEDAVTKTSNHHFSLSLSHNDSHTRFSFLLQLRFACGFDITYV